MPILYKWQKAGRAQEACDVGGFRQVHAGLACAWTKAHHIAWDCVAVLASAPDVHTRLALE